VLAVVAAVVASHPVRHWHNFTQPPTQIAGSDYTQAHFLSANGNWRWQFWNSAVDEFRSRPLVGRGAGSFEAWWAQHGIAIGFVANPHSLYFETLGELGIIGLGVLVSAVALGAIASIRGLRRATSREAAAALAAGFVAFALASGVDWMWELPVVSCIGLALLALALAAAGDRPPTATRPGRRRLALAATIVFGVAALAVEVDVYGADAGLRASRANVARGNLAAAELPAARASRLQPWAATPYLQLALVAAGTDRLALAQRRMGSALSRQPDDWRLWLIDAQIHTRRGQIVAARRSLDRARELNPRSPLFNQLQLPSPTPGK
jgi:O-antigen ligase